jgi:basic membrane protein A
MSAVAALALTACGKSSTSTTSSTATPGSGSSSTTTASGGAKFLACEVTDTGGINDRSFNASAYAGLKAAALVDPNINTFISDKCGIIVTVGFDMGAATQTAAKAHPTQKFSIVDFTYPTVIPNILALVYHTNQDAFLGGYLAAAMSKSGAVGTFGGQNIPTVTLYMDGWVAGVRYYDKLNHASVKALGWTPKNPRPAGSFAGSGLFTNDFTNEGLGETDARTLMSDGADVIFPVAGAVGLGAAAAVKQAGPGHLMEWVDTDGCVSAPQYCSLFITSVTKGIAVSVAAAVLAAAKGTFKGGNYNGTLANGGVALSPYHDFASKIPAKVQAEIATLKAGIISGKISVDPDSYPAS